MPASALRPSMTSSPATPGAGFPSCSGSRVPWEGRCGQQSTSPRARRLDGTPPRLPARRSTCPCASLDFKKSPPYCSSGLPPSPEAWDGLLGRPGGGVGGTCCERAEAMLDARWERHATNLHGAAAHGSRRSLTPRARTSRAVAPAVAGRGHRRFSDNEVADDPIWRALPIRQRRGSAAGPLRVSHCPRRAGL